MTRPVATNLARSGQPRQCHLLEDRDRIFRKNAAVRVQTDRVADAVEGVFGTLQPPRAGGTRISARAAVLLASDARASSTATTVVDGGLDKSDYRSNGLTLRGTLASYIKAAVASL